MLQTNLSLLSISNYWDKVGSSLFDELEVPEGVDKNVIVNNILFQGGTFEPLYTDPYMLKHFIGVWSKASQDKWNRMHDAWLKASEFNPLENYDRTEKTTDTTSVASNIVNEQKVSAYDSIDYSESGLNTTSQNPDDNKTVYDHDMHVHGNIGVTSLAQLLEGYDRAVIDWDLISFITHNFIQMFCIMVY